MYCNRMLLIQRRIAGQFVEHKNCRVFYPNWVIYIRSSLSEAKGSSWKRGQKNVKSQKCYMATRMQCCVGTTEQLHSETHTLKAENLT